MKKSFLLLSFVFVSALISAQADTNVKTQKKGNVTEATYYYEDGTIQQEGSFNAKGKLHGTWTSYDINGKKLAVGNYLNGKKTGKWFFWTNNSLKEVDYIDSKISTVNEWKDKTKLAVRN